MLGVYYLGLGYYASNTMDKENILLSFGTYQTQFTIKQQHQ
jgi:hypothetical protein